MKGLTLAVLTYLSNIIAGSLLPTVWHVRRWVCQYFRRVVELGFIHGNGDLLKRDEYLAKQRAIADYRQSLLNKGPKPLLGAGKDVKGSPLLKVRSIERHSHFSLCLG